MIVTAIDTRQLGDPTTGLLILRSDSDAVGLAPCPVAALEQARMLGGGHLVGEDPRAAPSLWRRLRDLVGTGAVQAVGGDVRSAGVAPADRHVFDQATAALDLALWDLAARARSEPLWLTLGGARPRLPVYLPIDPAEAAAAGGLERASGVARAERIRAVQLASGGDPQGDASALAELRERLDLPGDPVTLLLDLAAAGNLKQALQHVRAVERTVDLTWVRDPRPAWDATGLRRIVEAVSCAVCCGGTLGPEAFLGLMDDGAANVVEIDLSRTGVSGALQVALAAHGLDLAVTLSAAPGAIETHLGSVLPNVSWLSRPVAGLLPAALGSAVRCTEGWVSAGDLPGLGLTLASRP